MSGEEDEFSDRIMEMDWGEDEEERKPGTPDMFEMERSKSSLKKEKVKEEPAKNKFAELMAKPPTPQVQFVIIHVQFGCVHIWCLINV